MTIEVGKTYRFFDDKVVEVTEVTGATFNDGKYIEVVGTYLRKDGKRGMTGVHILPDNAVPVDGR